MSHSDELSHRCVICGRAREQVEALVFVKNASLCAECVDAGSELVSRELRRDAIPIEIAKRLGQAMSQRLVVALDLGSRALEGHVKSIKYQYLYGTVAVTWVLFEELDGSFSQLNASLIRRLNFKAAPPEAVAPEEQAAPFRDRPLEEPTEPAADAVEPQKAESSAIAALEKVFAKKQEEGSHFGESLGAYLVRLGMVTEEQIKQALRDRRPDEELGPLLVRLKLVQGVDAKKALELQYGIPFSDVPNLKISDDVLGKLPAEMIRHHRILPVKFQNDILTVAMVNPKNSDAIDDIRYHLNGAAMDVRIMSEHDFADFVAKRLG